MREVVDITTRLCDIKNRLREIANDCEQKKKTIYNLRKEKKSENKMLNNERLFEGKIPLRGENIEKCAGYGGSAGATMAASRNYIWGLLVAIERLLGACVPVGGVRLGVCACHRPPAAAGCVIGWGWGLGLGAW